MASLESKWNEYTLSILFEHSSFAGFVNLLWKTLFRYFGHFQKKLKTNLFNCDDNGKCIYCSNKNLAVNKWRGMVSILKKKGTKRSKKRRSLFEDYKKSIRINGVFISHLKIRQLRDPLKGRSRHFHINFTII